MEPDTPIVIVADPGTEAEARTRLARIGFDTVEGYLDDAIAVFTEHPDHVERLSRLAVGQLAERMQSVPELVIVDIRNPGETALGTVPGAHTVGLPTLLRDMHELDPEAPTVVYCAGGYRSAIAASLLRAHGFADVSDLIGGYSAWIGAEIPEERPEIGVDEVVDDPSMFRLDVREDFEWEAGHAPDAVHIPMGELPQHLSALDANRRIACICRSGNRSGTVTNWLLQQGFDALNVMGGMTAWARHGHPVVTDEGRSGSVV
jgi:rhodanese-related sulfurtransferase